MKSWNRSNDTSDKTRESKWDPIYEGPFTIVSINSGGAYIVKYTTGTVLDRRFTIDMMKVIPSNIVDNNLLSKEEDVNQLIEKDVNNILNKREVDKHYTVENILDHKNYNTGHGYEYLVKL